MRRERRPRSGPKFVAVDNLAALNTAIDAATGGEVIVVANGNYGQLVRSSANPATAYVTISGESLAGVTIAGLALRNQSYLHFDNMTIDAQSTVQTGGHFWLSGCKASGLYCKNLHNQILEYNEFHSAEYCLVIADINRSTHDVLIHHNIIHGALIDCVEFAAGDGNFSGQIENVTFRNNLIYDAALTAKYHGDGHQWWIYRTTFGKAGVKNFQILDNVYVLAAPAQCLFINFEASRYDKMAQDETGVALSFTSPEGHFGTLNKTVDIIGYLQSSANYRARFIGAASDFSTVSVNDWVTVARAVPGSGITDNNGDYFICEKDINGSWINGIPRAAMYDGGVIAGNFIVGNGPYAATIQGGADVLFDENMVLGVSGSTRDMNILIRAFSKDVTVNANNISNTEKPPALMMPAEADLQTPTVSIARDNLLLPDHMDLCFSNPRTQVSRFLPGDFYPTPYLDALAPGHRAIAAIKALVAPPPFYLRLPDDFYDPAAPLHVDLTAANITTGAALAGETCVWDWGDGSATEAGVSVGHDFDIQGDYKVKATIGTDTVERQVVVKSRFPTYLPLLSEGLANHGWARDTWSEVGTISYPNPELTAGTNYIEGLLETFKLAVPTFTASIKFKVSAGQSGAPIYIQNVLMVRVIVPNGLSLTVGTNSVTVAGLRLDQAPYLDTYNRITVVADNGTASAYLNDATTPFTTFACPSLVGPQTFTTRLGNYFSWTGNISDLVIVPDVLDCSVGAETAVLAAIAANEMVYDIPVAEDFSVTWDPDADGVMRVDVSSHVSVDASGDTPFDSEYISIPAGTITSGWEAKVEPKTGLIGISSTGGSLPASTDYAIYTNPGFLYAQGTITWTA